MRAPRLVIAAIVAAGAVAAALWVAGYRVARVREYVGDDGRAFHPPERTLEEPWWTAFAALAVLVAGFVVAARVARVRRRSAGSNRRVPVDHGLS